MGTGHVMRCLTLAQYLQGYGHNCYFLCRQHPGNLVGLIQSRGFDVSILHNVQTEDEYMLDNASIPQHSKWLGANWQTDAVQTRDWLDQRKPDWLIVDHYALDHQWETYQHSVVGRIMVIDDLADRYHQCDLLLDQTYGETEARYANLVPPKTLVLAGARYALLRKEFDLDTSVLKREKHTRDSRHLLITLGGSDPANITQQIIQALQGWRDDLGKVTVIAGHSNPHLQSLQAMTSPFDITLLAGVNNMADIMRHHDLAVGASGCSTWERCALGMPTVALVTAENQQTIIKRLESTAAVKRLDPPYTSEKLQACIEPWLNDRSAYLKAVDACFGICDGKGTERVCEKILGL
jgi:UDP-2,4-diacetamido-2,4,6-trideoxy-beta-L-altropyranose hydrolase